MSDRGGDPRRGFLATLTGGLTALVAGMAALPSLGFLAWPWRGRGGPSHPRGGPRRGESGPSLAGEHLWPAPRRLDAHRSGQAGRGLADPDPRGPRACVLDGVPAPGLWRRLERKDRKVRLPLP